MPGLSLQNHQILSKTPDLHSLVRTMGENCNLLSISERFISSAMNIFEFNYVADNEVRAQIALVFGSYLCTRLDEKHEIRLYHYNCFFIEVWYLFDGSQIIKVSAFKNQVLLKPYLPYITLPNL